MKARILLIFVGVLLLFQTQIQAQHPSFSKPSVSSAKSNRLDSFIQSEISQQKIPGAVALVLKENQLIYQSAFGYSDAVNKVPMKADDIFFMQSMTKPIISVAFMMLYEEGHFQLNDPVSKYIPAFATMRVSRDPAVGIAAPTDSLLSQITIAQVLSHTSGLMHGLGSSNLEKDFRRIYYGFPFPENITGVVSRMSTIPMTGQPGMQWNYSAGPDILSALIEKFSGKSTALFLKERIFDPLGMQNTGYNLLTDQSSRVVKVHSSAQDGKLLVVPNQPKTSGNTIWFGTHGLFSTAQDYLVFCQMLLNNGIWEGKRYLKKKTIDLMTSNQSGNLYNKPGEGFGLGFAVVQNTAATRLPGSDGLFYWSGANNTHFFINPKEKLIAILLTQKVPHDFYYHEKLRELVHQSFIK